MLPPWIFTEPVDITAVTANMVLMARVDGPGAVTVEATEDGDLLITGKPETLNPDEMHDLTQLADAILIGRPTMGLTWRYDETADGFRRLI